MWDKKRGCCCPLHQIPCNTSIKPTEESRGESQKERWTTESRRHTGHRRACQQLSLKGSLTLVQQIPFLFFALSFLPANRSRLCTPTHKLGDSHYGGKGCQTQDRGWENFSACFCLDRGHWGTHDELNFDFKNLVCVFHSALFNLLCPCRLISWIKYHFFKQTSSWFILLALSALLGYVIYFKKLSFL